LERVTEVFKGSNKPNDYPVDSKPLHAKIEQPTLENNFSEGAFTKDGVLSAKR
jgi:hypothetical protein